MGHIRGNRTNQQRLWGESSRAPQIAYQYEYPTQGYESIVLSEAEIGPLKATLSQVNDYANKKRMYSVHRKVGDSEAYWIFNTRSEADTQYDSIIREAR